jgi:hypothetical protein
MAIETLEMLSNLKERVNTSGEMTQKEKDKEQYFTPKELTRALMSRVPIYGKVFEPCAGKNWITDVLEDHGLTVFTSDIDEEMKTHYHFDATDPGNWDRNYDWVVTNPPFSKAPEILKNAYEHANVGVAFLARLSFLEPCAGRDKFLLRMPPDKLIVLPRVSFSRDGGKDTVTVCWMVWIKKPMNIGRPIEVVPRDILV